MVSRCSFSSLLRYQRLKLLEGVAPHDQNLVSRSDSH
jgi:hypothetical protein